jgi:hypothetical protein
MPLVWPVFAGSLAISAVMLVVSTFVRDRVRHQGRGDTLPCTNSPLRLAAFVFVGPLAMLYVFVALAYLTLFLSSGAVAGLF